MLCSLRSLLAAIPIWSFMVFYKPILHRPLSRTALNCRHYQLKTFTKFWNSDSTVSCNESNGLFGLIFIHSSWPVTEISFSFLWRLLLTLLIHLLTVLISFHTHLLTISEVLSHICLSKNRNSMTALLVIFKEDYGRERKQFYTFSMSFETFLKLKNRKFD